MAINSVPIDRVFYWLPSKQLLTLVYLVRKGKQTMMIDRSVEVEVACSVEQVYNLWSNMENVPRWMPLVKHVQILPGTDNLSRWTFGTGAPLLIEWTSRITRRIPSRLIAWESVSGLRNQGLAEFFPTDRGCRLCLTLAFELPKGLVGVLLKGIGVERWLEANLVESLNRFQALIEAEVLRQASVQQTI